MYALVSLILIIALSMFIVRVGTIALQMTGMSQDVASFQSLSAFSGAGYTTEEAETILSHPVRRTIVKTLIRLGSVGAITAIATLVLSFLDAPTRFDRFLLLVVSAAFLVALSRSRWFSRILNPFIRHVLQDTATFEVRDYTGLLRLHGEYRVADLNAPEDSWLANEYIQDLKLRSDENVVILGIRRADGTYVGAPTGEDMIRAGDTVIAYGTESRLQEIAERTKDEDLTSDTYDPTDIQNRFDIR